MERNNISGYSRFIKPFKAISDKLLTAVSKLKYWKNSFKGRLLNTLGDQKKILSYMSQQRIVNLSHYLTFYALELMKVCVEKNKYSEVIVHQVHIEEVEKLNLSSESYFTVEHFKDRSYDVLAAIRNSTACHDKMLEWIVYWDKNWNIHDSNWIMTFMFWAEILKVEWSLDVSSILIENEWIKPLKFVLHVGADRTSIKDYFVKRKPINWSYRASFDWEEAWIDTSNSNVFKIPTSKEWYNPDNIAETELRYYVHWIDRDLYYILLELLIDVTHERLDDIISDEESYKLICQFTDIPSYLPWNQVNTQPLKSLENWILDPQKLYEKTWAKLFWDISKSKDYSEATSTEMDIFLNHKSDIHPFMNNTFVDIWCWNWGKSVSIFNIFWENDIEFLWIDISTKMALIASKNIYDTFNGNIPIHNKLLSFSNLTSLSWVNNKTVVLLWYSFWNMSHEEQKIFLKSMADEILGDGDSLILTVFLKQNTETIIKLYDNPQGRMFILNPFITMWALENQMKHIIEYDENEGIVRIYVEFHENIELTSWNEKINKKKWERVLAISSQRFSEDYLNELFNETGLNIKFQWKEKTYWLYVLGK